MDYVTLGRTGLKVSVAGLGCGGFSRLGLSQGKSEAEAVALVREALDLGVNLLDTASAYGTERVVGQAIKQVARDQVVVCTKAPMHVGDSRTSAQAVVDSLDRSLKALEVDCIDVFQLHAVNPRTYALAHDVLAPALLREKEKGKFRFLGLTETSPGDHPHAMLQRAVPDGLWDTAMLGFHMMHQNARAAVFPLTRQHRVGTLLMFAVRKIFAAPERVAEAARELIAAGQVPAGLGSDLLGFLLHPGGASSLTDAAYRFVRHEPGVDVVLFGTGDRAHLRSNIASILKPPLPLADHQAIVQRFGHLVGVGLDRPGHASPAPR